MATTEIGELLIRIRADMAKLEEALQKSGTQVKSFSDKVTATGKNLTSAGLKLSLAVTVPLVLIGKKSIDAAMDVVESENLFEVSMGNMADAARNWSEEFAKSVGLNEYNVRRNVGIFNVMFDSMGIGEQKAYDMAKGLTSLAYDMASFYNLDVEDAFQKLQAGITGEIEPLKRLGIVVNETTVATYAYANGIAEQGEKLTEQEKISARYLLIMDQTSKAQGDLARTLDSPANKMRIFKEQISLAMIELGQGLIPVVLKVVDIIKPFVEKFTNASDETKKFVTVLILIAGAAGPVLLILGQMFKAVGSLRNAFIGLNAAMHTAHGLLALKLGGILGSVVLALVQTGSSVQDMGDSFQRLDKLVFDATQTLNRANAGAFSDSTEITKELAGENLKLLENIEGLAKEYPLLVDKVLELNKKYSAGTITYGEYNEELKLLIENKDSLTESTDELATSEDKLTTVIKSNVESLISQGYKQQEAIDLAREQAKAMGYTDDEINNVIEAQYNLGEETEDTTKSIEDQTTAVDDLRSSFNKLIDAIFDGITSYNDFQESQWAVEEAQKKVQEAEKALEEAEKKTGSTFTQNDAALQSYLSTNIAYLENQQQQASLQEKLNEFISKGDTSSLEYLKTQESLNTVTAEGNKIIEEAIKKTGTYNSTGEQTETQIEATAEATKELEQAQNDLDDAMLKLLEDSFALSTSIYATAEQQEEARKKAVELGLEYVNTGLLSVDAFLEMAAQFGLSAGDIIKYADEMNIVIDDAVRARLVVIDADATPLYGVVGEVNKALNSIPKKITTVIDVLYNQSITSMPGAPVKPGSGKQSGGEMGKTEYIPDLKIIGVKGEGFLTREIMNAIKTNRTDYMGVAGRAKEPMPGTAVAKSVLLHIPLNLDGKTIYDIWEKYDLREGARRIK